MIRSLKRMALAPVLLIVVFAAGADRHPASAASPPVFGTHINLGAAGGEPSIQDDGQGHVYITTPQGLGSTSSGVLLTRSTDGGQTFLANQTVGGVVGGGDSDVVSDVTGGHVYIADLAATHSNILASTDHGANFGPAVVAGPDDDREWLTTVGQTLYLTYHDFALNVPLFYISTDHGVTFLPGGTNGQIIGPTDTGFADTKCNTLVGKPVVDAQGTIYILTNTSTNAEDVAAGCALTAPLDRFYMSVSTNGGTTFTTHLVSDIAKVTTGKANSGSWGHVFNQLGIDAGGNLYIDASGTLDGTLPLQNYLLVSKDHGVSFSAPIPTHPGTGFGQLFPAIAVGQSGQVAVGYYQGTKADHRLTGNNFQFVVDETLNALSPTPAFTEVQLAPLSGTTPHPGGICTDGTFCGTPQSSGGDRHLADFESMCVDPTGHLEIIIPADSDGATTENWYYKQTTGDLLVPGPTNGNGTGNQTYVPGSQGGVLPEVPFVAGLVVVGAGTATAVVLVRRRNQRKDRGLET